jgi:hypothetical protein
MNIREDLIDRRLYETRGVAIKDQEMGRPLSPDRKGTIQEQFIKKYGSGWELAAEHQGALVDSYPNDLWPDGHILIFKRRRQLRDE